MSPGSSSHSSVGSKSASIFSGTSSRSARPRRPADAPAPPPGELQQEDVVGVDVRADAAAVAGVGDHDVVEPGVGHEAEALQQPMRRIVVQVDALHQQRPAGRRQRRQRAARERPVAQRSSARRRGSPGATRRRRGRRARTAAARSKPGSGSASAPRTSSGFFCQWRRMNAAGARPPSSGVGRSMSMVHCAMIVRCRSAPLASSP